MTATAKITTVIVRKTTLNSIITRVILKEITLLDSEATMETSFIMVILIGLVHSIAICPYP